MAEFGVGFKVYADAAQFKREMKETAESAKALQKGFKEIGVGIGQFIGVGAIVGMFSSVLDSAQAARDKAMEMGVAIDSATMATARLGDMWDAMKKSVISVGAEVIGFYVKVGEEAGRNYEKIHRRMTDAQLDLADRVSKEAEVNIRQMERVGTNAMKVADEIRQNHLKFAETEKKIAEAGLSDVEKLNLLKEKNNALAAGMIEMGNANLRIDKQSNEYADRELEIKNLQAKVDAEAAKASDKANADKNAQFQKDFAALEKLKFDRLSGEEQVAALERDLVAIRKDYNREKLAGNNTTALEVEMLTKENELTETRAKLVKQVAIETEKAIETEAQRIEKLITQANKWLGGMGTVRGGAQFNDASDETLKTIISRNRAQARDVTNPALYGPAQARENQMEAARLSFEADNAQQVLDARASLQANVRMGGVDYARSQYQGDPLMFDQMLQRWVTDTRTQAEIARESNTLLTDLNTRLLKMGFSK